MIQIVDYNNSKFWDNIAKSFSNCDVYYLSGYVKAFQIHGDGEPQLLYYETEKLKAIYVYMKRKTAIEGYYDSVTPYGYGGVLFEGETSEENLHVFWKAYVMKMKEEGIVDNFVRYHPVLANATPMKQISTVIDLGKTIAFDLSSEEVIWSNITSKNRNMIRKAEKNGIEIRHGKDMELFKAFKRIYTAAAPIALHIFYYICSFNNKRLILQRTCTEDHPYGNSATGEFRFIPRENRRFKYKTLLRSNII